MSSKKAPARPNPVGQTLESFASWTSASAIPNAGRSKNTCCRWFWILICIACFLAFVIQMYYLMSDYLQYPTNTKVTLKFEMISFPDVTICSLNPYKKSRINAYPQLQSLLQNFDDVYNLGPGASDPYNLRECNNTSEQEAKTSALLNMLVAQLDDSSFLDVTNDYEDMVMSCRFNEQPCGKADFREVPDPLYGRCYTFNTKSFSQRAGWRFGLRLQLKTNKAEIINIAESQGFLVAITEPGLKSFPDSYGYSIPVGMTSSFAMKYVRTVQMGSPFGNCIDVKNYSLAGDICYHNCMQRQLQSECGCGYAVYDLNYPSNQYCDLSAYDCIHEALLTANANSTRGSSDTTVSINNCQCSHMCDEGSYFATPATGIWPSEPYLNVLCEMDKNFSSQSDCRDWYRQSTALVELYYEAFNYEELQESAAYPLVSLISDFGGQIGLWIGFSFVTVFEFLFLPFHLVKACCGSNSSFSKAGPDDNKDNRFDQFGNNSQAPAQNLEVDYYKRDPYPLPPPPPVH